MHEEHDARLTPLLDGTVLVAGGQDCSNGDCATKGSAELYVPAGVLPPAGLPAALSPTPIPIADPEPDPGPAPGWSHPAGRTDLEGHGRQPQRPTRDVVRGRRGRARPHGAAGRIRDAERRAARRHRGGDVPASREGGGGLVDLREPGTRTTEQRSGGPTNPWRARSTSSTTVNRPGCPEDQRDRRLKVARSRVVVALLAITGCTTGQPSGGESASPSMASLSSAAASSRHQRQARPAPQPAPNCRRFTMAHSWPARTGCRSGTRAAASASQVAAHLPHMTPCR